MTIPTLMTKVQKHRVETRLKGFYSNINQAMRLSQEEFGDIEGLIVRDENGLFNGNKYYTYEENLEFLQKYIAPFIKLSGYRLCPGSTNQVCADLLDGGLMWINIDVNGGNLVYLMDGKYEDRNIKTSHKWFVFQFAKYNKSFSNADAHINSSNFVEPYTHQWDGTRDGLKTHERYGCRKGANYNFCAKYIQMNGWKIPDDYPW